MASSLQIANEALAECACGSIASFDENSLEANEVNRFFDLVFAELLDWTEWSFARRYVVLAEVTNDRAAEWNYCYALPTDCAAPLKIRSSMPDADELPSYGPMSYPWQDEAPVSFIVEGGKIYTNAETATLVYTTTNIQPSELSPLVRRAFSLELASRIAYPIKKDAKLKGELIQAAEVAKARAISDEENKNPRIAPRYVSDAEYARLGHI